MIGIVVFIFGAAVGSFLNVCIYRIPLGQSIVRTSSRCSICGKHIAFYDNLPLISFLLLRGRCRYCKERISLLYPLVEFLTAALFLLIYLRFGLGEVTFRYYFLTSVLILAGLIDLKHGVVPDKVTYFLICVGLLFRLKHGLTGLYSGLIGLLAGAGFLYIVSILGKAMLKRESMGGGDIKLAGAIGTFLGWKGVLVSFFLASVLGTMVWLPLILLRIKNRTDQIPFAPFVSLGSLIYIFCKDYILSYLGI